MKKILLLSVFSLFIFNSCRDDSSTDDISIVGTWKTEKTVVKSGKNTAVVIGTITPTSCEKKGSIEFTADNKVNEIDFAQDANSNCVSDGTDTYIYSLDKKTMLLYISGFPLKVISLTNNKMVVDNDLSYDYNNDGVDDVFEVHYVK